MWKVFENIIGMFVYGAVYLLIALVAVKVVGATLSPYFEQKISEEGNLGLAVVYACVFIGLAILLSSVVH